VIVLLFDEARQFETVAAFSRPPAKGEQLIDIDSRLWIVRTVDQFTWLPDVYLAKGDVQSTGTVGGVLP
jgi:hypothetical protein